MTSIPAGRENVDLPASTDQELSKLQKHFGRTDIFFYLVCTLFGVDGLGTLATKGGAGFTWLVVCLILFAGPAALLLAELGATYTDEGGPYVWTRMAFGHLAAAVNNLLYWVTNPVWMGGTLVGTAIGGLTVFFNNDSDFGKVFLYVFGMLFIWAGVLFAILSFRVGKWISTIGAFARFALLGVFALVIVLYGSQHGLHGIGAGDLKPSFSSFVALVPLILFSLVGFELPSASGDEMTDAAKDVPSGIAKSLVTVGVLYALPVLGILLVLPASQASGLAGFPDAIKQALTVFGGSVITAQDGTATAHLSGAGEAIGWVMGILIVIVAFTSGLTWIMGSDRALAVSCLDKAGPRFFGKFSAVHGTPVRVNVLSGVVSTIVFIAATEITSGNAAKFFTVGLSLAVSTTLMSYIGLFPAVVMMRRKDPDRPRPFRAPAAGVMTVIAMAFILFCTVQVLFPGLGDSWFGSDYRPDGWDFSERWVYLLTEAVPLIIFVGTGVAFWLIGRRQNSDDGPAEATGAPDVPVGVAG